MGVASTSPGPRTTHASRARGRKARMATAGGPDLHQVRAQNVKGIAVLRAQELRDFVFRRRRFHQKL